MNADPGSAAPYPPLSEQDALHLLGNGAMELEGRLTGASNTTLRAYLTLDGVEARCVYKPVRGERPLWDFPDGTLAGREVAAYEVARGTGWDLVPPTVLRDGPLGTGACQLWIEEPARAEPLLGFVPADALPAGWLRVATARDERGEPYLLAHADDPRLARMAVFDAIVNNADRKGGHVLTAQASRIYGVDHGVCFHRENKLRTVLWGWADRELAAEALAVLDRLPAQLDEELGRRLAAHLSRAELTALRTRVEALRAAGRFPLPGGDWPAVPWPPM